MTTEPTIINWIPIEEFDYENGTGRYFIKDGKYRYIDDGCFELNIGIEIVYYDELTKKFINQSPYMREPYEFEPKYFAKL